MTQPTYTAICLKLNTETDADIVAFLQDKKKATLIKNLLRDYMRECGIPVRKY